MKANRMVKVALAAVALIGTAILNTSGSQVYYSGQAGANPWETVDRWNKYMADGGGPLGWVPTLNDTVLINASTLSAEAGRALEINSGVNAEALKFACGYQNFAGSAHLKLNGGTLTSSTDVVIGQYYRGLATLESGRIYCSQNFIVGENGPSGYGTVTNTAATIDAIRMRLGYTSGSYGKLVHLGGALTCRWDYSSFLVGYNGGVGEFEANAGFTTKIMTIGGCSTNPPQPCGTGTVTVAENVSGYVRDNLKVANGTLNMRGGTIYLNNEFAADYGNLATNLYVQTESNGIATIKGWGTFRPTSETTVLRMIHNGKVVADGEGVERDLNLNLIAVVNNTINYGPEGDNGWYATNKGRILFPRTSQTFTGGKNYCLGDLNVKTNPDMVNSVGFAFTTGFNAMVRGGFCDAARNDIPAGLPQHLRPVGVWFIGAFKERVSMADKISFDFVSLTFRYDQAQLRAIDTQLRLYRYDGTAWVKVGEGLPGGDHLISTTAPLPPVAYGDYNMGWFALMAAGNNGTLISIH